MSDKQSGTDAPVPVGASVPTEQSATTKTTTTAALYPVRVRINPEDRLAAAKAGLPTAPEIRLPLTAPAVVGLAEDGYLVMDLPYVSRSIYDPGPSVYDHATLRAAYRSTDPAATYAAEYRRIQAEKEERRVAAEAERTRMAENEARAEAAAAAVGPTSPTCLYPHSDGTVGVHTDMPGIRPNLSVEVPADVDAIRAEVARQQGLLADARAEDDARKAEAEAQATAARQERDTWITTHGSPGLQERVRRGYDCERRYITERLTLELPGWVATQWDNMPDVDESRSRSDPSDKALEAERQAEAAGYSARTYWVIYEADDDGGVTEREETVIEDYHGHEVYRVGSS